MNSYVVPTRLAEFSSLDDSYTRAQLLQMDEPLASLRDSAGVPVKDILTT